MKTARTRLAFSVLIVLAMVSSGLGVSAIFRSTGPAVSGPTGDLGTRSEGAPTAVSMTGSSANGAQEESLPIQTPTSAAQTDPAPARKVSHDEMRELNQNAPAGNGYITTKVIKSETGTRNPFFDAGGPYGGPDCFEGTCTVHFEAVTDDPTIIFYRWDFNDDGIWDTPWSTDSFFDKVFNDNFYGEVRAEGWDGISTTTYILTGNNLGETTSWQWYIYPGNTGWKFRPKVDIAATQLGYYLYGWSYYGLEIKIWDFASQMELGGCTPSTMNWYSWNWCTLASPINLYLGSEYIVSYHQTSDYWPYWIGSYNQGFSWEKVEYQGFYYQWGWYGYYIFPVNYGGAEPIPLVDFQWRQVLVVPLTQQDTAQLDVNNISPQPYGIMTDPSPALEGTGAKFSAWFNDPGTDDTWKYRWYFGDGTWSPWQNVKKYAGGASVMIYHSITGNIGQFKTDIIDKCGNFCITVDDFDFGPLGQNRHLTLGDLMAYDVLYVETNWGPIPDQNGAGDLIADYMDQKGDQGAGGIVTGWGPYISGSPWEFRGRYFSDEYNPVTKSGRYFGYVNLGSIYVPGHPILDGISTVSTYLHITTYSTTAGATRVADWTDGAVAIATKENPIVPNGAISVAMPFTPWYMCNGDCVQLVVNALRYASRQPDPTPLTMPIQLPWTSHIYKDDEPVTTSPWDDIDVKVEVKDDDHLKVEGKTTLMAQEGFDNDCNYYSFPPGWENDPYWGWKCYYDWNLGSNAAVIWYYDNDYSTSLLSSPTYDLSAYNAAKLEWRQFWWADYGGASQDGYVEISTDGGMTYPYIIAEFHHNQPGQETKTYLADIPFVSDQVRVRYRFESAFDWCWVVDNIKVYGLQGRLVWGLGEDWGTITIANVPPSIIGGPMSGLRTEAQSFSIEGLALTDPAIMEPTEWFAYKMDFDDGTPSSWIYKGTLAPPKQDILFINSICYSGNGCGEIMNIINMLNAMDLVGSVTAYNFFEQLSAPSLSYMLQFDVIMFGSNWAYFSYPPYESAKLLTGNRMADYLDAHRGGVVTWMATYDNSPYYGEIFSLTGRYIDQDYGPFEKETYPFGDGTMGVVHYPDHPVMKGVTDVASTVIHSGDQRSTAGGIRLASFTDGGAFVGVKAKDGDKLSCAINAYTGGYGGAHASKLLRQCIGWAIGGIPTPDIPPIVHTWGDNGLYTVDLEAIDDDMGYVWDFTNNVPVADPMYEQIPTSHRYIPVEVENVDPTIHSTAAFTEADLCIRMTGNKGNDATLTVMGTDGSYYTVTTTRVPGQPAVGCLPTIRIDMTPSTQYTFTIAYDPTGDDGANPEWIFSSEFPDGKIKELRYTFNSNNGPQVLTIGNKEFKRLAVGSPLTFEATASDPGSDDLAFAWVWSDLTPYDIHIYAHPGIFYQYAASDMFDLLPFKEPRFYKDVNDQRSPESDPIRAHDAADHQFADGQMPYFLYVTLIVMDDDVTDLYPSTFMYPGMDMEVIPIDL